MKGAVRGGTRGHKARGHHAANAAFQTANKTVTSAPRQESAGTAAATRRHVALGHVPTNLAIQILLLESVRAELQQLHQFRLERLPGEERSGRFAPKLTALGNAPLGHVGCHTPHTTAPAHGTNQGRAPEQVARIETRGGGTTVQLSTCPQKPHTMSGKTKARHGLTNCACERSTRKMTLLHAIEAGIRMPLEQTQQRRSSSAHFAATL